MNEKQLRDKFRAELNKQIKQINNKTGESGDYINYSWQRIESPTSPGIPDLLLSVFTKQETQDIWIEFKILPSSNLTSESILRPVQAAWWQNRVQTRAGIGAVIWGLNGLYGAFTAMQINPIAGTKNQGLTRETSSGFSVDLSERFEGYILKKYFFLKSGLYTYIGRLSHVELIGGEPDNRTGNGLDGAPGDAPDSKKNTGDSAPVFCCKGNYCGGIFDTAIMTESLPALISMILRKK